MGKWGASGEPLDDDAREQVGEPLTGTVDVAEGQQPPAALGGVVGSGRYFSEGEPIDVPEREYVPVGGETREGGSRVVDGSGEPVSGDGPVELTAPDVLDLDEPAGEPAPPAEASEPADLQQ